MGLWLLTLPAVLAEDVAVVIGASTLWEDGCVEEPALCTPEARAEEGRLRFADDDTWRVSFLLTASFPEDRILVFTDPDEGVGSRSFPGGAPKPAELPVIVGELEALQAQLGEPLELSLYLAAHGHPEGVHLDDAFYSFEALSSQLLSATGGGSMRVVLEDVCLSGTWPGWEQYRGGGWEGLLRRGRLPPVEEHDASYTEASVDSNTPEDPDLQGGHFTHLLTSALVGGGDWDNSGEVDAQELSDFVFSYLFSMGIPYVPVIRASKREPFQNPFSGGGGLLLSDESGDSRWFVTVAQPDQSVLIAEAFTSAGDEKHLHLPPGEYTIWRIPYTSAEGVAVRPAGDRGESCAAALRAAETLSFVDCRDRESFIWDFSRGSAEPAAHPPGEEMIAALLRRSHMTLLTPPSGTSARYHQAERTWLSLGSALESGAAARGGLLLGPGLALSRSGLLPKSHLLFDARLLWEIGADHPSDAAVARLGLGLDRALWSTPALRTAAFTRLSGGLLRLEALDLYGEEVQRLSPLFGMDLGASASGTAQSWGWRIELSWKPELLLEDDDGDGGAAPVLYLGRLGGVAAVEWKL